MVKQYVTRLDTSLPTKLTRLAMGDTAIVESSIVAYVMGDMYSAEILQQITLRSAQVNSGILEALEAASLPRTIETAIDLFETLIDPQDVAKHGMVFTPLPIAEFISERAIHDSNPSTQTTVIDPSVGCGIFLVAAAKALAKATGQPINTVLEHNIFGIELHAETARRCEIALRLFSFLEAKSLPSTLHIVCADSLRSDWADATGRKTFDVIVGNPPYVNTHDMDQETSEFLRRTFETTREGVFNIFYAFIEKSMRYLSPAGELGFIIPNNFLYIKSAGLLRKFLADSRQVRRIIDFADTMAFRPVRTYTALLFVGGSKTDRIEYAVLPEGKDLGSTLKQLSYKRLPVASLQSTGWHLVDQTVQENIQKIESASYPLKSCIRTGIATLKDDVYMVSQDESGFYKNSNGIRYDIEPEIVKRFYKVPELKHADSLDAIQRYIIFPYTLLEDRAIIIPEDSMKSRYPQAYAYLRAVKSSLDARDKGKPNKITWYAYGRTQGLTKFGTKLFYPTFSAKPRFTLSEDAEALFCNGYAIYENDHLPLTVLEKILNSKIMDYYIRHTSYQIEGGYFCYQKKYLENFSIPKLSNSQTTKILTLTGVQLDNYLIKLYDLSDVK